MTLADSFMVSADNAHALHPNHTDKTDPVNRPVLNGGIVIKYNANQKYCTDGVSAAIFKDICDRAEVPYQTFVNRSDMAGGSTLGNISNTQVPMKTVDIGLAQLAMHSVYETTGAKDTESLAKAAAKLTYAFANATVPKVNVVIGKAFGSAYVTMNSKSLGADMVYAWPTAEIGMMEADLAAKIMYADADAETINEKAKEYAELQSSPVSAARRGYVDTIIQPADTRKYVIGAFEMLFTKREESPMKKHGTV